MSVKELEKTYFGYISNNQYKLLQTFLGDEENRKKININTKDEDGRTGLHLASAAGSIEIAKELIKYGADINCQDEEGW